jgi:hypothetical protein
MAAPTGFRPMRTRTTEASTPQAEALKLVDEPHQAGIRLVGDAQGLLPTDPRHTPPARAARLAEGLDALGLEDRAVDRLDFAIEVGVVFADRVDQDGVLRGFPKRS